MSDETYITFAKAAKQTPGRPSTGTIWRWARRGILARDGRCVRLQHVRVGGRMFTQLEWLEAFFRAVADADLLKTSWQHPNRTGVSTMPLQHADADAELREAGA